MRRKICVRILTALVVSVCILCGPASAEVYKAKIVGGPTGGTANTFTSAMAVYVSKAYEDIKASPVASGGAVENIKRMHSGQSELGVAMAVSLALAAKGELTKDPKKYDQVRFMGYVWGAPAQLIVRADSNIKSPMDLVGKRVAVGSAGSGAAAGAERYFRHLGLWDKMKTNFLGYSAAATAFKDKKIDAFWIVSGAPNRSVIEASVQVKIRLVDLHPDAEKSGFYNAFAYAPVDIPAGTYEGLPVNQTFQDSVLLCANAGEPEAQIYKIMKALWSKEGIAAMAAAKKTFKDMGLETGIMGISIPLHSGAYKFWAEQGKSIPSKFKPTN